MKILKENIKKLFVEVDYTIKHKYEDKDLNILFNYWMFFEEKEILIQNKINKSLEVILYSKYYWCSRFKEKYIELIGIDEGIEQQQYKIIEEIEQRLENGVDWKIIQSLEEQSKARF